MRLFFITCLLLSLFKFFSSCSSTKGIRVQVLRPAIISVPKDIQKLAILNRAVPASKNSAESIVTGEAPLRDKELSEECLRGLTQTLNTSERFKISICDSAYLASDPKSLDFGTALSWTFVDSMCSKIPS